MDLWDFSDEAAAAAQGFNDLATSIGNYKNQQAANRTNLQIADNANKANLAIAQMNNQAMIDLWREQMAYNSPANQSSLWQQAGFNPISMLGQSGGLAGASPSLSPAHMNPARVEPIDLGGGPLGRLSQNLLALSAAEKNIKEGHESDVRSKVADSMLPFDVERAGYENRIKSKDADLSENTYLQRLATVDAMFAEYQKRLEMLEYERQVAAVQSQIEMQYIPQRAKEEFNLLTQRVLNAKSEGELISAQRDFQRYQRTYLQNKDAREQVRMSFQNLLDQKLGNLYDKEAYESEQRGDLLNVESRWKNTAYGDFLTYHSELAFIAAQSAETNLEMAKAALREQKIHLKYSEQQEFLKTVNQVTNMAFEFENLRNRSMTAGAYERQVDKINEYYDNKINKKYANIYYEYVRGKGWRLKGMNRQGYEPQGFNPLNNP